MRLTLVAPGSRGDVQPFIALGAGLHAAGHDVQLATHERFRSSVEERRLRFALLGGDPQRMLEDPAIRGLGDSGGNPLRWLRAFRQSLRDLGDRVAEDTWVAVHGAEGVVHCGVPSLTAYYAAEALGLPSAGAAVQPLSPTRAFPAMTLLDPGLPGVVNLASHAIAEQGVWQLFRGPIARSQRRRGLRPARRRGPFADWRRQGHLQLYGFSPTLVPEPWDWRPHEKVTGAWSLHSPDGTRLSEDLEDFLWPLDRPPSISASAAWSPPTPLH